MKNLLLLLFLIPIGATAKKDIDSFVTKSGFVIYEGDSLQLGTGYMDNGKFAFIQVPYGRRPYPSSTVDKTLYNLEAIDTSITVKVDKIKILQGRKVIVINMEKIPGRKASYFVLPDEAIKTGEIIIEK